MYIYICIIPDSYASRGGPQAPLTNTRLLLVSVTLPTAPGSGSVGNLEFVGNPVPSNDGFLGPAGCTCIQSAKTLDPIGPKDT